MTAGRRTPSPPTPPPPPTAQAELVRGGGAGDVRGGPGGRPDAQLLAAEADELGDGLRATACPGTCAAPDVTTDRPARRDFPVDDWLHGVARVRERSCGTWENVVLLCGAPAGRDGAGAAARPAAARGRASPGWRWRSPAPGRPSAGRPAALHRHSSRSRSTRTQPQCGLLVDEWTEVIPATPRRPASRSTTTGPTPSRHRPGCSRCPRRRRGRGVGRPRRRRARDPRRGQAAGAGAGAPRRHAATPRFLPATHSACDLPGDLDLQQPAAQPQCLPPARGRVRRWPTDARPTNIERALLARLLPAVTLWNRLEGRPRRHDFDRALRAEVRDALWMLTRQWQMGEFRGDDAGSPVLARGLPRPRTLDRYQPGHGPAQDVSTPTASRGQVERRRLPLAHRPAVPLAGPAAGVGRRWLKLLVARLPERRRAPDDFRDAYAVAVPDPAARRRRRRSARTRRCGSRSAAPPAGRWTASPYRAPRGRAAARRRRDDGPAGHAGQLERPADAAA